MDMPNTFYPQVSDILAIETEAAHNRAQWAVIYNLVPYKEGTQWCVMLGENLQNGVSGFGDSPQAAIYAFNDAMRECIPTGEETK